MENLSTHPLGAEGLCIHAPIELFMLSDCVEMNTFFLHSKC